MKGSNIMDDLKIALAQTRATLHTINNAVDRKEIGRNEVNHTLNYHKAREINLDQLIKLQLQSNGTNSKSHDERI